MRIVARLFVLFPLLWVERLWAVDCTDANYFLGSQAEVDALGDTGCDRVSGYLWVRNSSDITNLDGLVNITSVGGRLEIGHTPAITNLDGLANITSVGGDLIIQWNAALTNLDGLANIISLGSGVYIGNNDALTSLDGLASLTSVKGWLRIIDNDALVNLNGLANITSVGGRLEIANETALTNLDGLANITSVGGHLSMANNGALTNLDGLARLTSVGGDLTLNRNTALTNLDGLANITNVGGALYIWNNTSLANLDGLASLTSLGSSLSIYLNAALTNLNGLSSVTSVPSFLEIKRNSALTNLDGLTNTTSIGGYLHVANNTALTNLDGLVNITNIASYLTIDANNNATCEGIAKLLGWPNGPPADTIDGVITIGNNGLGCDSVEEILASVSGPTQPAITGAIAARDSGIQLEFSASTTTDNLFPVTGYEATCIGSSADLNETAAAALLDNTPVTRTLSVSSYDPVSVPSAIEVDINITHSDPTDLFITLTSPEGTELVLWNQSGSGGEDLIGTFPTTLTAVDSLDSVTRQTMDGDWKLTIEDIDVGPLVREGVLNSWGVRITEELARNGSGSPITVNGVTRGRDYSCTVAPVTGLGKVPVSDAVTAKSDFPSTPNIDSTDFEDGKISLRVSVDDNGGADITEYEATCTDGTNTYTGTSTSSPIIVSGLTNDVAYTCTVTATNSVGTSSASAATAPITPEATATGLPIWLLYQATQ